MQHKKISDETLGQFIIDNLPQSAWIKNCDLMYVNCNKGFTNRFGEQLTNNMLGKKDNELPWECYSNTYQTADKEVLHSDDAIEYLHLAQINRYEHMVMSTKKSVLKNMSGDYIGVLGIVNLLWPSTQHAYRVLMDLDDKLIAQSGYKIDQYVLYENTICNTENLTKKELLCLFYLLRGASNKDISRLLFISLRTVESHIENIRTKLNCYSKTELIGKAIEKNMLRLIPKDIKIQDFLVIKQKL